MSIIFKIKTLNHYRIYNLSTREIPEQAIAVANMSSQGVIGPYSSKLGGGSLLGETAVAFDYGPVLELESSLNSQSNDNRSISNVVGIM